MLERTKESKEPTPSFSQRRNLGANQGKNQPRSHIHISETEQNPVRPSQLRKPFCVPCLLLVEKLQSPRHPLSHKRLKQLMVRAIESQNL